MTSATFPISNDLLGDPAIDRARRIWGAGDYDRISAGFREEAEAFVARRGLKRGMRVLDAACGSGNLTVPAARTGASVTGIDLVSQLLTATLKWAGRERLDVTLDEGTVERLPYGDAEFDVVLSMFGLMFAARPDAVMRELVRVTKPGGTVALANWTRGGFIGRMFALHTGMVPPPSGVPSPLLWGDEAVLHERFEDRDWTRVTVERRTLTFRYALTPAGTAELFRSSYGPTVRTYEALDEDRRAAFGAAMAEHWIRGNRAQGQVTVADAEYVEVVAVRRQG